MPGALPRRLRVVGQEGDTRATTELSEISNGSFELDWAATVEAGLTAMTENR